MLWHWIVLGLSVGCLIDLILNKVGMYRKAYPLWSDGSIRTLRYFVIFIFWPFIAVVGIAAILSGLFKGRPKD